MTTVADVDRQVNSDDAIAARLWPKLGPKVRTAYLHDRDAWTAIRRDVDAGKQPSAETLAAQHKAFAGWARAFHAVSNPHKRRPCCAADRYRRGACRDRGGGNRPAARSR